MKGKINYVAGWLAISGAVGFAAIVFMLHLLQPNHSPVHQLMSELALGPYGSAMLVAFSSFSISVFGVQLGLGLFHASSIVRVLLVMAAISLFGAGIFRLGDATEVHVALIAIAFFLLGLVMYLLPCRASVLNSQALTIISWSLGLGAALSVALGHSLIPMGIGQRTATICILVWLSWLGWKILAHEK